jgi:hypothetical protein
MPWPWLRAHGGLPRPWLLHAHGGLPRPWLLHALALAAACLGLGCCMPWPWLLHAHGGLPRPWLLHALALAGFPKNEGFLEKEVI